MKNIEKNLTLNRVEKLAKREAIAFVNWINEYSGYSPGISDTSIWTHRTKKPVTTEWLYEEYLKGNK